MVAVYGVRGADGKGEAPGLLALALEETFGLREVPERGLLPGGKPFFPARPGIHFNLSHSGPLALCAVGDVPVGVDVELVRPRTPGLPRHVLSGEEYRWFAERGERWEDFYTLWTLKEARLKYEGTGLKRPARTAAVPLCSPGGTGEREGLVFRAWGGAGWRAALCAPAGEALPQEILGKISFS